MFAFRELDETLGLSRMAGQRLSDGRVGKPSITVSWSFCARIFHSRDHKENVG
jgi:hypothetical protein